MAVTITAAVFFTWMAVGIDGEPHALQQIGQALRGEHGLLPVAGAGQADHQAVAHQLVVAHAFERDQFLQARGARGAPAASNECRIRTGCQ